MDLYEYYKKLREQSAKDNIELWNRLFPEYKIKATENSDEENPLCLTIVLSMEQAKDVWFELNKEFGNK